MSANSSFDDLMARLRMGNEAAAQQLVQRFTPRLIALARGHLDAVLRRKVDPEDVLQSAYKSFFRRYGEGEHDLTSWDSLWGLLALITLRKCDRKAEHFHAACRDVRREATPALEQPEAVWTALSREPTPLEAAVLAETVQQLLDELDQRDRGIVSLRLQGYAVPEIVAQVGRPERAVYRVLERVRQKMEDRRDNPTGRRTDG